ncbi:MAG: AAA family ATPase [Planctomycetota bacterium]
MSQPTEMPGNGDVDSKLDSLLSRIQSLSGQEQEERPKQQPRPATGAAAGPRPVAASESLADSLGGGVQGPSPRPAPRMPAGQGPPAPATRPARPTGKQPAGQQTSNRPAAKVDLTVKAPPMPIGFESSRDEPWRPGEPDDMKTAGLNESILESIIYRFLLSMGEAEGRKVSDQVKVPFRLVEPILTRLKMEQNVAYKNSTATNDYVYILTETGRQIARNHLNDCTYFGACPVPLRDYIASVKRQTIEGQYPKKQDLLKAFHDLLINPRMLDKLGPAVASGRGMFLFGFPGNGKTSIAERVTGAFGKYVWIPRAVDIDGDILRVFDPMCHTLAMPEGGSGLLDVGGFDKRWVRIERPTIIAGGELTMDMLEVQCNSETNISEAPLQLKSNCGTLVIDDFGRQKMRVDELLNRWIVPLEKRYDFLNMASGKKIQVPFDQLVVFSTNLEPKDLVDDAFLRRIPYKIEAENPPETDFRKLFEIMCKVTKVPHNPEAIDYLIETHYKPINRPMRMCQPRDLLLQVKNYCLYNDIPIELKKEYFDFACENYFSVM